MKHKPVIAKPLDPRGYAEGRTYGFQPHTAIDSACLQVIAYRGARQTVRCRTAEFSAVCPFSGLPDLGTVTVTYVPGRYCIELKSLKYYFVSFRQVGIYQEEATDRIFSDLWRAVRPRYLKVETVYNTRGGIDTECTIQKGTPA